MKTYNKKQLVTYRMRTPDGNVLYGADSIPRVALLARVDGAWRVFGYYQNGRNAQLAARRWGRTFPNWDFATSLVEVL